MQHTTREQTRDDDAVALAPRGTRSSGWIGRAVFEAVLIVFGLVGALLIDEWRDTRERNERVRTALVAIRTELEVNRQALAGALANHERVIARLRESAESKTAYQGGIIAAAPFSSVAWEAARDAGITTDLDHATLVALGHAYRALADYIGERAVFSNYLYTNNTTNLRQTPLALAGWLNDMSGHARGVDKWIDGALRALAARGDGQR